MQTERGRKRGMISPQEIFLSSFLVFISQPSISPFLFHRHTCSHCLPSSSSSLSLKNKKYCCTCREAAPSVFSLFFFTPLVQRAVDCDRCWKDVSEKERGRDWDWGMKGGRREGVDVEMEVPKEGRGSDGMLVSLCPSKRSNNSSEGRWWRGK